MDLYKKLRDLYNAQLAESLIDKKVQKYRNELLGIREPVHYGNIASVTCVDGMTSINTVVTGETNAVINN